MICARCGRAIRRDPEGRRSALGCLCHPFLPAVSLPESPLDLEITRELTRLEVNTPAFAFMLAHLRCWLCDERIVEEPSKRSDATMTTTLTCLGGCGSRWWAEERTLARPRGRRPETR